MNMEKARFSETLASTYETTRRQQPRQHQHYTNRRENLRCHHEPKTSVLLVLGLHVLEKYWQLKRFDE
jgi:hypothetical protein